MEGQYEYIEKYFKQTLNGQERKIFEDRCVNDTDFANEVAFYITSRQVIRQELLQQKLKTWNEEGDANTIDTPKIAIPRLDRGEMPQNKRRSLIWYPFAAAACIILAIALYFLVKPSSPQQLAREYVNKNYSQLSLTMSGGQDSLQMAIEAYNNRDYTKAVLFFEALEISHPNDGDDKKYAGLVYLFTNNYDKALQHFDELAKMKGLFNNAGNFLKAVTLLQRSRTYDKENAKLLLQQVVKENSEGSEQAKDWLKKL